MSSDEWSGARFAAYVEELVGIIGHADRAAPLRAYCTGLLMPAERKSVEPIAAITAPARVAAQHQSLLHFVGQAPWSDGAVLTKVRDLVLPAIEQTGAIEAWIVDDTSFPKKGRHSVGVARQYCGQLGKQDGFVTLWAADAIRYVSARVRRLHQPHCAMPQTPPLGRAGGYEQRRDDGER